MDRKHCAKFARINVTMGHMLCEVLEKFFHIIHVKSVMLLVWLDSLKQFQCCGDLTVAVHMECIFRKVVFEILYLPN